jgi:hypothetical protein
MADVASSLKNWSSTPASNSPTSATTIGTGLAPNFQQIQATLRNELGSRSASVTAAATTDIGTKDEGTVLVTNAAGTIAITSFGTVSAGIKKLITFVVSGGSLSLTHNATSMILPGSANITVATGDSLLAESLGSGNWKVHTYTTQSGSTPSGVTSSQLQNQTFTTFTTGGTSTAYTLTPTPALTALTTGHRFNVTFNATAGATPTLAISGLTAKLLKVYDTTGAKVAASSSTIVANINTDVIYDGTDYVALNPVISVSATPSVRQTVLSGTVDTSGLPSFGGAAGTTTVTTSTTLTATAANGTANRTGSIANPAWTGLSTNGMMYLYLDIDASGVCTTGSTTLLPTYRWGGADVTTNNQFTFNIQEMQGKVGNGAVATQTYRVFVGEVLVAAGVVSTITWYALMGRFESAYTATLPNLATTASANHNIGVLPRFARAIYECTSAELGYAVGDTAELVANGATLVHPTLSTTNKVIRITGGSTNTGWYLTRQDTGAGNSVTRASWKYKFVAERGW